jgi:hypothetical protein
MPRLQGVKRVVDPHTTTITPASHERSQPVTAPPAQRGDGHPVSDPARGIDPAESVDDVRAARRAGQRHRAARARIALAAAAGAGAWDNGETGCAVMAASRTGGCCAAGSRRGRDDRPPDACSSDVCFEEIAPVWVSEVQGLPKEARVVL